MAAAFAALVSLKNNLLLTQNHPRHSFSFEDKQIQSLLESVCFLIDFMKSYDNTHGAGKEAAEALERRIARAAEAAEYVIETHVVDQIHGGKTKSKTRSSRFFLDVQKVIDDMGYMRRKAIIVKARSGTGAEQEQPTYSAAVTSSSSTPLTSNKTSMVGFDDILLQLLDNLTRLSSSRQVIPIIGMGGIGKTTLATNAFQHPLIVHHFDVCLWATISQEYSVEKILKQLVSCLRKYIVDEATSVTLDDLGLQLHKNLYGRRYLIILDDMWTLQAWDEIKNLFPDTNNGSRIVVTTRQSDVAKHLGNLRLSLSFLDDDDSWDLFCQKAFAEQDCPPELEQIGKKIVEKCKGLPLTIVVVGGHLRKSSLTLEYWENVAHRMNSVLSSKENEQCLNVLYLSYSYLPVHLKPCFLLIGAFPEDQEIFAADLLQLWIAEGFIEPFDNIHLKKVAENYLWDLFERNLILVFNLGYEEEIYKFKVHDLLRELCIEIAKKEEFLYVIDTPRAINRERRAVICGKVPEMNHQTKTFDDGIRTRFLICEGGRLPNELKLLRLLNMVVASSTSESIFQQLNLRCVTVDYKMLPTLYLPSSISLLWNLQILKIIVPNQSTVIAPYEIWEMLQLRHLEVVSICLVDPLPMERLDGEASELVLRNLHTLHAVENFRLSDEVCKRIPNIRRLVLGYGDYCDDARSYYCPNNLGNFHELESLFCSFDDSIKWRDFALSLTFPSSLKRLLLNGCGVDWEELTTMVGSLPNLTYLQLYPYSVIGSTWTPVEGKFLRLKMLEIHGLNDLIYWNADNFHFPVLESLYLENLSKLDELPSGIGEIPTLRNIIMEFCSVTSTLSAMRTLVEQEEQGNEGLILGVVFRGDEETLESFNNKVQEESLTSNHLMLDLQTVMQ